MTVANTADLPTAHAHRYLQQICKHWAHSLAVEHDEASGRITLPRDARGANWPGDAVIRLAAKDHIPHCRIQASVEEQLDGLRGALARHLDRFAFREAPLPFDWKKT